MVKTAPVRSVRFAAAIVPPIASTKPAADGKAQPGAGPHLIALADPVEPVEDALQILRRHARPLVGMTGCRTHPPSRARRGCAMRRAVGRVFGGVVEQVEQHLLEQHGIEPAASAGRAAMSISTRWRASDLRRAAQRAADDVADIVQRA